MRRTIPFVVTALVALAVTATAPVAAGASDSLTLLGSFETYNTFGFTPDDVTYSPVDGHLFICSHYIAGRGSAVFETTLAGELIADYGLGQYAGNLCYSIAQVTTGPAEGHFFMASYTGGPEVSVLEFDADWNLVGQFPFTGVCSPGDGIAYNPVSGTLLISDICGNDNDPSGSRIFEVTMQGVPVRSFSALPCGDVAGIVFNLPTQTYLAVCWGQSTLQEFSMNGEPLRSWDLGAYGVRLPVGIAAGEGKVFIAAAVDYPCPCGGLIYTFEILPLTTLYLHADASSNPPTLTLDETAPTSATGKWSDSAAIKYAGGNVWKQVGTWNSAPQSSGGTLQGLEDVHVWLGLKNSDDQGTLFDVRADVYAGSTLVASGTSLCVSGITRNPDRAKEVTISFGSSSATALAANGTLTLKLSTRIGTNADGSRCTPGHANAVGLRVYYDSTAFPARFGYTLGL